MGYASQSGRASTNPNSPRAFAVCDRCGFWYSHVDLRRQFQWAGTKLQDQGILVCTVTCLDIPQPQLMARILPPDPIPIRDPRPEWFSLDEGAGGGGGNAITDDGTPVTTSDGQGVEIDP